MEESERATTNQGSDRRTWLIGAIVVAALIAITTAAVALTTMQEDATYADGSPEATVRAYADAWAAGDIDAAYRLLTPRAQARVPMYEFREALSWDEDRPTRVWIEDRVDSTDRVSLKLSVDTTYDGLLGPDRDTHTLRVTLIQIDDAWRIDTALAGFYPW